MGAVAILYGVQAASGAGQAVFGMQQAQQARRREALLRAQGLPKLATPQEYFELYQNASRSNQFEQEKAMTESIMASNLNALVAAGSRAVIGGAPAATLQAQRGIAGAAQRDFQRQQAALGTLAAAEARTGGLNFQQESAQYARDLIGAQAGYQAGIETALSGADMAIGSAAMAVKSSQDGGTGDDDDNLKTLGVQVTDPNQINPASLRATPGFGFDQGTEVPGMIRIPGRDYRAGFDFTGEFSPNPNRATEFGFLPDYIPTSPTSVPAVSDPYSMFPFDVPPLDRAEGGSVTTPGKYTADHSLEYDVKTKAGKTIATLTGDETLVFNPMQRRFLKKIIRKLIKGETIRPTKADKKEANKTLKAFKK